MSYGGDGEVLPDDGPNTKTSLQRNTSRTEEVIIIEEAEEKVCAAVCEDKVFDCIAENQCVRCSPAFFLGFSLATDIVASALALALSDKDQKTTAFQVSGFASCSTLLMRAGDYYVSGADVYYKLGKKIKLSGKEVRKLVSGFNRDGLITTLAFIDLVAVMIGCYYPDTKKNAEIFALAATGVNLGIFLCKKLCCK